MHTVSCSISSWMKLYLAGTSGRALDLRMAYAARTGARIPEEMEMSSATPLPNLRGFLFCFF